MPECAIIHFRETDTTEIIGRIERKFSTNELPLRFDTYAEFDSEYDLVEKEEVITLLGGQPTISYAAELDRSRPDEACDLLECFLKQELAGMNFVVDNDLGQIVHSSSLGKTGEFLNAYRWHLQKERGPEKPSDETASRDD